MTKEKGITIEELFKRKDFICSTNVEKLLYDLLIKSGIKKGNVIARGMYDNQVGIAKDGIYSEFSKALGFKYEYTGFYEIKNLNK